MVRAGPYTDRRTIDLLNARFVNFYYDIGAGSPGHDSDAAAYVKSLDPRYELNPNMVDGSQAAIMIVSPNDEKLAGYGNDVRTATFRQGLIDVLREHPEFNELTEDEQAIVDSASEMPDDVGAQLALAQLRERLSDLEAAQVAYTRVIELAADLAIEAEATLSAARIARYQGSRAVAQELLAKVDVLDAKLELGLGGAAAMERAHDLIKRRKFDDAIAILEPAIEANPESTVIAELHYWAGVASYDAGKKDWANYHWWWVIENRAEDRHYIAAWMSASIASFPFPHPHLTRQERTGGAITHDSADRARRAARKDYERILKELEERRNPPQDDNDDEEDF